MTENSRKAELLGALLDDPESWRDPLLPGLGLPFEDLLAASQAVRLR